MSYMHEKVPGLQGAYWKFSTQKKFNKKLERIGYFLIKEDIERERLIKMISLVYI